MKELLTLFAQGLVKDPRRVSVRERSEDGVVRLELEVAPDDRGRVIGRGGRTVDALRTVMQAVAARRAVSCDDRGRWMTAARAFSDLITIGRVVKPQGRKGEVLIEPLSDRPGRFSELKRVFVPGGRRRGRASGRSTASWPHKGPRTS